MERTITDPVDRRIESLTVNLLECYEELDLVYRLSRSLKSTLDAKESARLVVCEAREIFEADLGLLLRGDAAGAEVPTVVDGDVPGSVEPLRGAVLGELARRGRSQIFHPVGRELGLSGDDLPESLLCAVVKTEDTVYGALCVGRKRAGRLFTARDLKLADALASQAALAIEHAILQRRWREEEHARIRLAEEMRLAREIQTRLLPSRPPAVPGYEIACRGVPALSVGGDYYDFIPLEDGRLAMCLADVSGKGMPAALLMANLQATIRSQALASVSPAECVRRSNRLLFHSTDASRFATCFYALLDPASGRLTYSNGGHDYPLLVGADGRRFPLETGGLLLGMVDDHPYREATATLEPGHLLVAYSDGITEAMDGRDRLFGLAGLEQALAQAHGGSAEQVLEAILQAATTHAGGRDQADDMTLVVVRRR